MSGIIEIKKGREKPIIQQHPWIFSGAIHEVRDNPTPGDIVTVVDFKGKFLARGYWNPKSQIQVRILSWQDEAIDEDWWRRMLERSIKERIWGSWQFPDNINRYCRLVNAENDYLPGLIVDRYGKWLIMQALTLGIDQRKGMIADILMSILPQLAGVFERSDVDVRGKEGLSQVTGLIRGEEPPQFIKIDQSLDILVDVRKGHKTGILS